MLNERRVQPPGDWTRAGVGGTNAWPMTISGWAGTESMGTSTTYVQRARAGASIAHILQLHKDDDG